MNNGFFVCINNDFKLTWYPNEDTDIKLELNNLYYLSFEITFAAEFVDFYNTNYQYVGYWHKGNGFGLDKVNKYFVTEAEFKANLRDKRIDEILGDE